METIQNLDHLTMAIYLITAILGLIAVILAGFLLINEKRKHPWESKEHNLFKEQTRPYILRIYKNKGC